MKKLPKPKFLPGDIVGFNGGLNQYGIISTVKTSILENPTDNKWVYKVGDYLDRFAEKDLISQKELTESFK